MADHKFQTADFGQQQNPVQNDLAETEGFRAPDQIVQDGFEAQHNGHFENDRVRSMATPIQQVQPVFKRQVNNTIPKSLRFSSMAWMCVSLIALLCSWSAVTFGGLWLSVSAFSMGLTACCITMCCINNADPTRSVRLLQHSFGLWIAVSVFSFIAGLLGILEGVFQPFCFQEEYRYYSEYNEEEYYSVYNHYAGWYWFSTCNNKTSRTFCFIMAALNLGQATLAFFSSVRLSQLTNQLGVPACCGICTVLPFDKKQITCCESCCACCRPGRTQVL